MMKRPFETEEEVEEEEEEQKRGAQKIVIRVTTSVLFTREMGSMIKPQQSSSRERHFGCGGYGGGGTTCCCCCQVDECERDLSEAKQYYKRHRVCEQHAKAVVVLFKGTPQRFCQQCSKFHALSEFDDERRSCRERLASHNKRRRLRSAVQELRAKGGGGTKLIADNM